MYKVESKGQNIYLTKNEVRLNEAAAQGRRDFHSRNSCPQSYDEKQKEAWRMGWSEAHRDYVLYYM